VAASSQPADAATTRVCLPVPDATTATLAAIDDAATAATNYATFAHSAESTRLVWFLPVSPLAAIQPISSWFSYSVLCPMARPGFFSMATATGPTPICRSEQWTCSQPESGEEGAIKGENQRRKGILKLPAQRGSLKMGT
jgi:hypothetical protein